MEESGKKWIDKKITRRDFLKKAGMTGAGAVVGASALGGFFANKAENNRAIADGEEKITFYGKHQAGITTLMQKCVYFVVLDLHSTKRDDVIDMFKEWTKYSEKLMNGELVEPALKNHYLPPKDTGETVGLNPYRLTLTFGISPSFFKKMNLENKSLEEFKDLPPFAREQLKEKYTGGDICIQACADDEQVAFHAVRNLVRKARSTVTMKWSQSGFAAIGNRLETPRNLFGFKDGTANATKEEQFDKIVWCDKDNWMKDGSYMAVRRIQMHLETWDRTSLTEQENTFGRYKDSGAPFGETDEFAPIDLNKKGPDGKPLIPVTSHVHLAHKPGVELLRRSYSYSDGINETTGQFDSGLLFISFQKDPKQFITIQNSLGNEDKMNEYITHIGSGLFACFGGIKEGEYIGKKLFD